MGTSGRQYFGSMSFLATLYVVIESLWGFKVVAVVCKDPPSELLMEGVVVLEEAVSALSELLLRVIVVSMGFYPHV